MGVLSNCLPTCTCLSPFSSQILKLDKAVVEALLIHCKWSKDRVLQQYLQNSAALMKEAGLGGADTADNPAPGSKVTCLVCLKEMGTEETAWLWCNHVCCKVGIYCGERCWSIFKNVVHIRISKRS